MIFQFACNILTIISGIEDVLVAKSGVIYVTLSYMQFFVLR